MEVNNGEKKLDFKSGIYTLFTTLKAAGLVDVFQQPVTAKPADMKIRMR